MRFDSRVQAAAKKLPVSAILLAMLAAVFGGVVGALFGGLIGSLLAIAMHISAREGESGYFIIFIGLVAIAIVTPTAVLLALYWRGVRQWWLLLGLIITFVGIACVGAAGFGIWYAAQPHILNANGPTPRLEFEVKPPDGASAQTLADYRQWSDWQKPDFVAKPGSQPSRAQGGADYQIRYRVDYQE
jgi:hypothetical protein